MDYDQDRPQIASLPEHANPLQEHHKDDAESDTMFLNIGPHHPLRPTGCST